MRHPPFHGIFRTVSIVSIRPILVEIWCGEFLARPSFFVGERDTLNDHVRTIATEMDENPLESVAMDSGITSD